MGFRFRKSKKIGPFRVNISKSGLGWSVGGKGFRYTKRADGKSQTTYSVPGTGISYVDVHGGKNSKNIKLHSYNNKNNKTPFYKKKWFLWVMLLFFPPLGIFLLWKNSNFKKKTKLILTGAFAVYSVLLYTPTNTNPPLVENQLETTENSINNNNNVNTDKNLYIPIQDKVENIETNDVEAENVNIDSTNEDTTVHSYNEGNYTQQEEITSEINPIGENQPVEEYISETPSSSVPVTNIEPEATTPIVTKVYIAGSGNGTKYHRYSSCSNMNSPIELDINEAQNRGYTACKKCY